LKNLQLGSRVDDRYRTVTELRIIDMLLLAGWVAELNAGERLEAAASTAATLQNLISLGLGYRVSERGERLFDPVEVVNCMKWAGLNDLDKFWVDRFVGTGRSLLREWDPATVEVGIRSKPNIRKPARFSVTLRRRFDLSRLQHGAKVRLRLPLPLSAFVSGDMEISTIISDDLSPSITRSDGRLDVKFAVPTDPIVDIAAELSFATTGRSTDAKVGGLDLNEAEIYLRPNEGLIRITPRIRALAENLSGHETIFQNIVAALWKFVIDELSCGMVHYDQVSADAPGDWVLDSGWYDCQLGSALFASMCRARGIPARIMSGYVLYRLAPGFHYWTEVWMESQGWTPFDLLSWDLSEAGRNNTWRDYFAGHIDYRMVTECMPLAFTGPMSVRFPAAWHLITTPSPTGMETCFSELDGSLIYSDHVSVRKLEPGLSAGAISSGADLTAVPH
jgi:transglutaminase-like putative cysteine protease